MIRKSAARDVQALIANLDDTDQVRREAAIARLAVIGAPAVSHLIALLARGASPVVREGALRALGATGDARALGVALSHIGDSDSAVSVAAIGVVRPFVTSPDGAVVLDRLIATALDSGRDEAVRMAAVEAIREVPGKAAAELRAKLAQDASASVRRRARAPGHQAEARRNPRELVQAAADGAGLPDNPEVLRRLVASLSGSLPLPVLHRLIGVVAAREAAEPSGPRQEAWKVTRGAVHAALAARGSRVALYDLRETLERARGPVPVEFLAAVERIGDASCLDALAAAFARTLAAGFPARDWWTEHLAAAFRGIVQRERLTSRHAAIKRIRARWPDAATVLLKQ